MPRLCGNYTATIRQLYGRIWVCFVFLCLRLVIFLSPPCINNRHTEQGYVHFHTSSHGTPLFTDGMLRNCVQLPRLTRSWGKASWLWLIHGRQANSAPRFPTNHATTSMCTKNCPCLANAAAVATKPCDKQIRIHKHMEPQKQNT